MTRALVAFGYGLILGFVLTALWAKLARRRKVLHRQAMRRWYRRVQRAAAYERVRVAVQLALLTGHTIYVQRPESWVPPEEARRN